jgi:predicted Zn-dependent peptidase
VKFEHARLSNGLEIIAEPNPDARSVAVGFCVRTGARDESAELSGVSHFLEHMVFKGSERRSALDVNREFDEIGAKYNAFTSEENTVFWGAVLPEYLPRLVDLLADMLRPSLRQEDFQVEKKVILEEISMYEDQPIWTAYERLMREHFDGHPLGNSILGTTQSIEALSRDEMQAYFDRRYVAGNVVVAVAGNVNWPRFCELIERACRSWPAGTAQRDLRPAGASGTFRLLTQKRIKQEHLVLMAPAPPAESTDRFAADVLATAVGDGTGSRLFWELVDPGFAETAEMEYREFNQAGAFMTSLSCDAADAPRNLARVRQLYAQVTAENIRADELEQVKNKAAARIVLSSERPMGRLWPLGMNWIYRREYRTVDDDLQTLRRITLADLARVLAQYPLDRLTAVAVGPLSEETFEKVTSAA